MLDVGITLLFGLVGLVMVYIDWPRPPLILGLVLGGLVERNFFISYELHGLTFLWRPIVVVTLVIGLGVLFLPSIQNTLPRWLGFKENAVVSEED